MHDRFVFLIKTNVIYILDSYSPHIDRQPIAAGRFYSANAESLELEINQHIKEAQNLMADTFPAQENLLALVAPHAGYVFSGTVAASAFMQLKDIEPRKKIFIIGSSHHTDFNGASIYNKGDYITPLGTVPVDLELANELIESSPVFEFVQAAHAHEHSLEVMLPFIQYFWKDNFEIIPIIIATRQNDICKQIAEILQPYFNSKNLFIFSTDLSHYPDYGDAIKVDKKTVDSVLTGSPDKLLDQIEKTKEEFIPNLATSMCGWTSILTMLYLKKEISQSSIFPILYQNSGDAKHHGEKDRVVGYQSMGLYIIEGDNTFFLTNNDKQALIDLAKKSIRFYIEEGDRFIPSKDQYSDKLTTNCGAFVSIYINRDLHGCIGRIKTTSTPLIHIVCDVAVSAAFYDNRFSPLTEEDLEKYQVEISVLTPLKKIDSIDEIEVGKHGIFIEKGIYSGTFLPQVGARTNWSVEEFLGKCAKDKAHIGYDGWKDADIFIYEAIVFTG